MTDSTDQLDSEFYQALLEQMTADFPWMYLDGDLSPRDVARRAAADSPAVGELRLSHLYTDAEMYLCLPDYRDGNAARAVFYHPLDRNIPAEDEGFIGSLGQSHETIATIYKSEYVQPVADPNVILYGCVPVDYTDQKLYSMMTAITATALRVQRLHEDIRFPVKEILAGTPTTPDGSSRNSECRISTRS